MSQKNIFGAVTVEIGDIDPHSRFGHSVGVDCASAHIGLVLESAVFLVDPQLIRITVIGDVDVRPAVAVQVGGDDAQSCPVRTGNARLYRDVFEGAVTTVAVEDTGDGLVCRGCTVVACARARIALLIILDTVIDVVGDIEIEKAVAIIIEECCACPPLAAPCDARSCRHIGEGSIAVVMKELIGCAEMGDEYVDASVVVEVADRHTHAVSPRAESRRFCDVGELENS